MTRPVMPFSIREDDLRGPVISALLEAHLDFARTVTPPGSVHALALDRLRVPEVSFWSVWSDATLVGCGALKELSSDHGEIKSMHTAATHRGQGVADARFGFERCPPFGQYFEDPNSVCMTLVL